MVHTGHGRVPRCVTGPQLHPGRLRLEAPPCGVWEGDLAQPRPRGPHPAALRPCSRAVLGIPPPPGSPLLDLAQPVLLCC